MKLNLYEDGRELEPLSYSTGKDQGELVRDILESFESSDVVFLKGVVGSGKSVVGIRTALEFGGGTISVPTKVLSRQYQDDYEGDKYFLKEDGEKARIGVLRGRGNFTCPYLEDQHSNWPSWKLSCQNRALPCTRPLGETTRSEEGVEVTEKESRITAVRECPYWGFIFPHAPELEKLKEHVGAYQSLAGKHSLLLNKDGCPYWGQFESYLTADVNVMNSSKWEIEAQIGRLPLTQLTVVDEADAWLDTLCSKVIVTNRRMERLADNLKGKGLDEEASKVKDIWSDYEEGFVEPLELARSLREFLEQIDFGTRLFWQLVKVLDFEEEVVSKEGEGKVTYFIPDPKPVLSSLRKKIGGKWLLMSATVQDQEVLNRIYGIDPVFVEGEVKFPGKLVRRRLGSEVRVNNANWKDPSFRREYSQVQARIFRRAARPGFVPVHATKYLPEGVDELTKSDRKEKEGIIFSTKMDRGADLEEMESVIPLKYPYPDLGDPLLRATKKRLGDKKFWIYYRDMSRREFIQQIGRTLRSPDDEVEFWSPDQICHENLQRDWRGEIIET